MFIWQYIDIPQNVVELLLQECRTKLPNNNIFFQPIDIDRTHFLDLELESTNLVQIIPMGGLQDECIHADIGFRHHLALNIPLENCSESITKFWKSDIPIGIRKRHYNIKYYQKISEVNFTQPFIFDSSILHSVTNPQSVWRRAISLRFIDDPSCLIEKYRRVG